MPTRRRRLTPLTDADLAAIAAAPPETTAAAIAQQLGRPYFTVAYNVRRIRRAGGWYSPLVWRDCTECGTSLATRATHGRTVHPWCEAARHARIARERRAAGLGTRSTSYVAAWRRRNPERTAAYREQDKAAQRAAYHALPAADQSALLARVHDADDRDYAVTLARATASGDRWTADDDAYLLAHVREPAREIALALGRTLWAVRGRRMKLLRASADASE
ncbi:MAG: hypothetical protein AB7R89_28670 [Dehalococcoidia bacterium]